MPSVNIGLARSAGRCSSPSGPRYDFLVLLDYVKAKMENGCLDAELPENTPNNKHNVYPFNKYHISSFLPLNGLEFAIRLMFKYQFTKY